METEFATDWWTFLSEAIFEGRLGMVLKALLILLAGLIAARWLSRGAVRLAQRFLDPQRRMLLRRGLSYGVLILAVFAALRELGVDLTVLLGAAGILTVAIGFASQTSASNLISGLFLIGERPFAVGDVIQIGDTVGIVLSVDLLSVKLQTFDNVYVRVPNEKVLKAEVRTLTRFPIRRFDLLLGVALREDLARVRRVLLDVADQHPLCCEEPIPAVYFKGFGDSSVEIRFSCWTATENWLEFTTSLFEAVKARFDEEGIEVPFPHRTIYPGSMAGPHKVSLVQGELEGPEPPVATPGRAQSRV